MNISGWKSQANPCDDIEVTRRLIDLFFVSDLLDAGACDTWRYTEPTTGQVYERSEGIDVTSLDMFKAGAFIFSGAEAIPIFGRFLLKTAGESSDLDVLRLWDVLQTLLIPVWPKDRTVVDNTPIGDVWPLRSGSTSQDVADSIQPFHKLTQWLTHSLMVPFIGKQWIRADSLMTLAEHRNGGLFADMGVLSLTEEALGRGLKASSGDLPLFEADVIVEWRAMTSVLIDKVFAMIQSHLGDGVTLTMAQLLEAGTWRSGREVAAQRRPETKSSPILIKSDGIVF
ncbi:duf1688 domain-containing protein [Fusarium austroafricanum]|uniref:Duf1688 domain-containing protein n=1 Tax=Fusarium austroafricanum TaxID=2364996 RepID=A0A8H4NXU2_9HYPO|nr:duf1688 domain-containing protein [Fusarium austroafricanum]